MSVTLFRHGHSQQVTISIGVRMCVCMFNFFSEMCDYLLFRIYSCWRQCHANGQSCGNQMGCRDVISKKQLAYTTTHISTRIWPGAVCCALSWKWCCVLRRWCVMWLLVVSCRLWIKSSIMMIQMIQMILLILLALAISDLNAWWTSSSISILHSP